MWNEKTHLKPLAYTFIKMSQYEQLCNECHGRTQLDFGIYREDQQSLSTDLY